MIEHIKKTLNENGCERLAPSSSYVELDEVLKDMGKFDDVIEIGTHNGLSAAVLTQYCRRVFTFDICCRNGDMVWDMLGVRDKISLFVGTPEMIETEIKYIQEEWNLRKVPLNFNLAFVDGGHHEWEVWHDFEMVKFTGKVLFHDYYTVADCKRVCDKIGAKPISKNIALWEAGCST